MLIGDQTVPRIVFDDKSGNLIDQVIWEFDLLPFEEWSLPYCKFVDAQLEDVECPRKCGHMLEVLCKKLEVELLGSRGSLELGAFLPLVDHGFTIVSPAFASRLLQSGLTGFDLQEVRIACNQTDIAVTNLFVLRIVGNGGVSRRLKVEGSDACPFCGFEPMICPTCGEINSPCVQCGNPTCSNDPGNKRLFYFSVKDQLVKRIAEKKQWDGSDWFSEKGTAGAWFVNERTKAFFDAQGLVDNEVILKPAWLSVSDS
jgi:hypothetical protein